MTILENFFFFTPLVKSFEFDLKISSSPSYQKKINKPTMALIHHRKSSLYNNYYNFTFAFFTPPLTNDRSPSARSRTCSGRWRNDIMSHDLLVVRMGGAETGVKPPFDCSLVSPKSKTGLGLGTYSLRGRDWAS